MTTILTIIGARPQFIKASVVSKAIAEKQFYGGGLAAKRIVEIFGEKELLKIMEVICLI